MNGLIEWVIFLALSTIAVVTAAGMIVTMSMYRAGLALMASFVALAGLFILLDADLLAAIQVMMNVGGMLVMVLFMVMIMIDPGGEMMWDMKRKMQLPGLAAFSMAMPREQPPKADAAQESKKSDVDTARDWTCPMHSEVSEAGPGTCPKCGMSLIPRVEAGEDISPSTQVQTYTCPMHPEVRQSTPGTCPKCGMQLVPREDKVEHTSHSHELNGQSVMAMEHSGNDHHDMPMSDHTMNTSGMTPRQHYEMMVGMAMSTAQLPWALVLGAISALLLIALVILTPWPLSGVGPTQDATNAVGDLLLSRYMIGFEGAAFLILAGIAGAVILGKREGRPAGLQVQENTAIASPHETVYTCPMHPEVRESAPGTCPQCAMKLIPLDELQASTSSSTHGGHA